MRKDGSQFWANVVISAVREVRLPLAAALADTPRCDENDEVPVGRPPHRLLIVDDNEDARVLLCELLEAEGHEVQTAGDGPAALELVAAFTPDVAILDLGLPVMDGFELAAQLRQKLASSVRLIALTGYGQPGDLERTSAAGFDAHLVKPVDLDRLIRSIEPE